MKLFSAEYCLLRLVAVLQGAPRDVVFHTTFHSRPL